MVWARKRSSPFGTRSCLTPTVVTDELAILALVIGHLDQAAIPYMLTGSIAAGYYAEPRMTRDADIVVELSRDDAPRLAAMFEPEFAADADTIARAIDRRQMFNLIHTTAIVKIDFIVRKDDPFRLEEFRRRHRVSLAGIDTWIVSPEDLILSKLHWAKDGHSELQLRDVRHLLSAVPGLDAAYLRKWAGHLGVTRLLEEVQVP